MAAAKIEDQGSLWGIRYIASKFRNINTIDFVSVQTMVSGARLPQYRIPYFNQHQERSSHPGFISDPFTSQNKWVYPIK